MEQKQIIEDGIKDFLTDNPMWSVVMISRKKHLVAGRPITNIENIARVMIQNPYFKKMVKEALKIADGDYQIIKEYHINHQIVIDSLFEQ